MCVYIYTRVYVSIYLHKTTYVSMHVCMYDLYLFGLYTSWFEHPYGVQKFLVLNLYTLLLRFAL